MRTALVCLLGSVCFMGLVPGASAQTRDDRVERTRQIFAEWDRLDSPGCSVGVVRDGEVVFEQGYGSANLDYGVPLTSQSVFYMASTSKQFAAASIALLALRGDLSLDDDVAQYIPEFPAYASPITIRHLVHHTSGVRDYLALRSIAGKDFEDFFDMAWAVDMITRQEDLNFAPGSEFLYSNSGYLLLAEIVARVTGQPLAEFGRENFFAPLGMEATHWGDDRHRVVANRVTSYDERDDGTQRRYLKNFHAMGDGNLLSSVEDLIEWDRMFFDTANTWAPLVELMHTPGVLNDGTTLDYAFGLFAGEYRDRRTISHGGAFLGFRTELLRFPDDRFTSIVLCNFGAADPTSYAKQVADIWLFDDVVADASQSPRADEVEAPRIDLPQSAMAALTGAYRNPDVPLGDVIVSLGDGALVLEAAGETFHLVPTAPDTFRSIDGPTPLRILFETDADGRTLRLLLPGDQEILLSEAEPVEQFTPTELGAFVGSFYSGEVDATYVVFERDGQLFVERSGSDESVLRRMSENQFAVGGSTLTFTRDGGGRVDGFSLDAGRVRGLRFVR